MRTDGYTDGQPAILIDAQRLATASDKGSCLSYTTFRNEMRERCGAQFSYYAYELHKTYILAWKYITRNLKARYNKAGHVQENIQGL
jgi:hypothetical protein